MLLQQHLPGKRFPALLALVRLHPCVNPDVHVVGDPLIKAFAAFRAAVLLPVAMDLHMGAQVAPVVEVFPAFWTGGCEFSGALVDASVVLVIS